MPSCGQTALTKTTQGITQLKLSPSATGISGRNCISRLQSTIQPEWLSGYYSCSGQISGLFGCVGIHVFQSISQTHLWQIHVNLLPSAPPVPHVAAPSSPVASYLPCGFAQRLEASSSPGGTGSCSPSRQGLSDWNGNVWNGNEVAVSNR